MLSDRLSVSLREIEEEWSICDVWDAHLALDIYEDLQTLVDRRLRPDKK